MVIVAVLARMNRQGRIVIPAEIRRRVRARVFLVELSGGNIVLRPVEPARLSEFFDSIQVDTGDFTDTHELRRALAGEGLEDEVP